MREPHYPVAIDFQGSLRSGLLAKLSGAKVIYGSSSPRERIALMFYTDKIKVRGGHIVEQNSALVDAFAASSFSIPKVELPRDQIAETKCDDYLNAHGIARLVLLNPGAGWGAKQWPANRYGEVAKELSASGIKCLINFGPGEETIAREVEATSEGSAKPIQLSVTGLIAFTRRAALFVGGDTGPLHLAAALEVPVVAIFGPTDPARNGPFGTKSRVLRNESSVTSHKRRSQPEEGLLSITVEQVLEASRELLGKTDV